MILWRNSYYYFNIIDVIEIFIKIKIVLLLFLLWFLSRICGRNSWLFLRLNWRLLIVVEIVRIVELTRSQYRLNWREAQRRRFLIIDSFLCYWRRRCTALTNWRCTLLRFIVLINLVLFVLFFVVIIVIIIEIWEPEFISVVHVRFRLRFAFFRSSCNWFRIRIYCCCRLCSRLFYLCFPSIVVPKVLQDIHIKWVGVVN